MSEDNYSLSSRVFHTIRENILSGKYATDEELKEKSIGEELGVSRTPVMHHRASHLISICSIQVRLWTL